MDEVIKFVKKFMAKIRDDDVGAYAGQSTLFIIMSFFPFVVSVFSILHYMPIGTEDTIVTLLTSALPDDLEKMATGLFKEIEEAASGGVLITTLIMGLWAASRGFMSLITGLNCIYGMRESRGYFKLRGISLLYTLFFIPASVITLVLMVYGKVIVNNVQATFTGPAFEIFFKIFNLGTWVTEVMLFLFFWALFIFVPNHRKHPLRELPGAMITTVAWVIFTDIYYVFYSTSANLSLLYGSLAVVILFVLWLYFCMYIVFVGAEINTELYEILELRNIYKK
ncbi:MAG: YihY/virulence factor BrkB family protein [Catonella sp.]|nr:YihY/virulence factor BrkB family protein [Catonella sp.]MDY6355658.1 YihY/virulence factor BrkB family protein [Catonella sp.]